MNKNLFSLAEGVGRSSLFFYAILPILENEDWLWYTVAGASTICLCLTLCITINKRFLAFLGERSIADKIEDCSILFAIAISRYAIHAYGLSVTFLILAMIDLLICFFYKAGKQLKS